MHTGVFMESHLDKFVQFVIRFLLLTHLCLSAPGLPGTEREEAAELHSPPAALHNPFGSGEEERRLLQSYIQSTLKVDGQGGPEINSREQEVFFLCHLYDYDRSGLLDGLEVMKLLSDYNSHHAPGKQPNELVVSMVDYLLQTQDLNQDGLLAPSELLSPSLPYTQDSGTNNVGHQEHEEVAEEKLSNPGTDMKEEDNVQPQHEVEEDELMKQLSENNGQAPAADQGDQGHQLDVPVHHGQPEI
ncbi:cell growth regulator with EF hand domain protein 1 [Solea solea]|uniref:cell growth regulator with EF hand domain protein 1 n=1 Tax=Solea solea TaxID=90069 RepID=UPI00272AD1BC|nr:cell growth regulator with EF hand domain protein 1 [Solea solea]